MSNPIYSQDLYQPGGQDTIASLQKQLVQLQSEMKGIVGLARQMKTVLAGTQGVGGKEKITDFATQTEKLRQQQERTKQAYARTQIALQRLAITQNQTAASANRLTITQNQAAASTLRLEAATKRADGATKKHSGSLTGMIGSIRNLAYAYFSLGAAAQVFQNILKQTKTLDTLNVAFNTTLGSIQATAQAQEFLLDITERYGANLLGASQAYLKFSAASTQAGVSAEETQKIFTSVTKASSILGLGAERTSYVFLALEQIMSKGRLSTEELRRQLGEHLPGAFGIAAEAMGVTTAKLTDMLKKGQIASTDFLPKFAVQLEKAYGITQVERIDNLAAAQERFNNQLTLLIKELDLSDAFKDFFNTLAALTKVFAENADVIIKVGKAILYMAAAWATYKLVAGRGAIATNLLTKAQNGLNAALAANPLGVFLAAIVLLLPQIQRLIRHINGVSDAAYEMRDAIDAMNSSFAEEYQSVTKSLKVFSDVNSTLNERKAAYDKINDVYPEILKNYDLEQRRVEDLTKAQEDLRTAIIDRIAGQALDESNKQLFKELQAANAFTPTTFSTSNQLGNGFDLSQEDIADARQKRADEALASSKERAAIILKTAEQMKSLRSLELDQLTKIDELQGRATGRSFGQVDQQIQLNEAKKAEVEIRKILDKFNQKELEAVIAANEGSILRKKIAQELLTSKFPAKASGGDDDGKKGKDPRLVEIDRLKFINSLRKDSLSKDLEALALNIAEKNIQYEKDAEALIAIERYKAAEIIAIREKYIGIEADLQEEQLEEQIKGYNELAKALKLAFATRASGNAGLTKDQKEKLVEEFALEQDHQARLFELKEDAEKKLAAFEIEQEIAKLDYILKLNEAHGDKLTDDEIRRINELRASLQQELLQPFGGDKSEANDIFSLLGIDFGGDNEKLDAFKETIDFVGGELQGFLDFQKEIVDQQIENADRLVRNAEENLNRQVALAAANQANNVAGAQAELALAKKTQEAALKQRRNTQKQELALDTLSQSSNLITAVTAALKLGPILGPIAVALILGTFAASKIKALQLINKKTFRKGGFREIGGGSHESGKDTHVGGNNWAEKDESVGIFTAKATRKYKPSLKAIVNAANKGTLENILVQDRRSIQGINMVNKTDIDTSLMEKRLTSVVGLLQSKTFVDGRGRLVRIDRGRTTIINK